jgi:hypothetical protein
LFAAGDTVQITNIGAGVCTITAGTATVNTSASLALAQYESGTLYFTSTSAAIFIKGAAGAAASGGMTLLSTTALSGTATTVSSIDQTYTNLFVYISTLTFSANAVLAVTTNSTTNYYSVKQQNNSFVYDNAVGQIRTNSAGTTNYSSVVVNINRYSDAARHTGDLAYFDANLGATGNTWFSINDAAAVTSITVTSLAGTSTLSAGSVLIYGVK